MKKFMAVAVMLCFTATGFAAWGTKNAGTKTAAPETKKQEVGLIIWNGKVTSVNIQQNEIVIKDDKTTYDKVLIVTPDMYKIFKLGDAVEVKAKSGTNIVENVKVTKAAQIETPVVPVKKKK